MLHSVRRAAVSAAAASSSQSPLPTRTGSAAVAAVAAVSGSCNHQLVLPIRSIAPQRRFSSSSSSSSSSKKPSSPSGAGRQPVHAAEADADTPSGKAARGAAVEDGAAQKPQRKPRQQKLPSVPSTQHIPAEFIGLSAFFSMHRPMSVTQSLPKSVTDELFASIFAAKPGRKKRDTSEVMSTLSQAVDSLESASGSGSSSSSTAAATQEFEEEDDGLHKFDITYASGDKARVVIGMGASNSLHTASAQFLPYSPPPVPVPSAPTGVVDEDAPADALGESVDESTAVATAARPTRRYQAMFTVVETREPDGQLSAYVADPQILQEGEGVARTFLERMALRQLRSRMRLSRIRQQHAAADTRLAISVKRQKKLKMKKKKYKKLQRRLKLEKRKLERN